ncbi:sigma factor-like helix-turn-helix DNA-binding protein [Kribbella sp. VKM Ac-2569]|uniref:sigma factor-like helix-turn-helix DNA-binding protein n=1 Tax=Kribbella sp. VKM Ac-2569 TaxID=2512220 RepID=UPI001F547A65|nr:sigma factor-like helix-turn-helix DNA-binding protein [Kribbella sp. VKM Ac-2569]
MRPLSPGTGERYPPELTSRTPRLSHVSGPLTPPRRLLSIARRTVADDLRRKTQLAGVPYAQTAAHLGCPVGTVRSRVSRARTTLADLLTA